jgi:hypothetical protein
MVRFRKPISTAGSTKIRQSNEDRRMRIMRDLSGKARGAAQSCSRSKREVALIQWCKSLV